MSKRKGRVPNRLATRKQSHLRVVPDGGSSAVTAQPLNDDLGPAGAVTASLLAEIAKVRTPLAAELVLCAAFKTFELGLPPDIDDDERAQALRLLLSQVTAHAETLATAESLALLRVCSALGPTQSRQAALEAADRLSALGVPDRPWARHVGSPTLLRAWHFRDMFGAQSSIGVLFDYQGREHALAVLIDHLLGGGIKDCWPTEGRSAKVMRNAAADAMAASPNALFEDVDAATAATLLATALANPPCPEQDDQIRDVAANLYLTRARAELLARLGGLPPFGEAAEPAPAADTADVLRIKVTIQGTKPPVWRRLEVPATITLARLHKVLQTAFGWTNSHLHGFEFDQGLRRPTAIKDAMLRRTRLGSVAGAVGDTLVYRYDYGDDWAHLIKVEDRFAAKEGSTYPTCTGGRRAGPPEDCGGVPGYAMLLDALADPGHPDRDELAEWLPSGFDPAEFNRDRVNAALGPT